MYSKSTIHPRYYQWDELQKRRLERASSIKYYRTVNRNQVNRRRKKNKQPKTHRS